MSSGTGAPLEALDPEFARGLSRVFVESPVLGYVRWDADLRVVEWSQRAQEILGWTAADVVGKRYDEIGFVHPDDLAAVAARIPVITAGEGRVRGASRAIARDGRLVHCEWSHARIELAGGCAIVSFVTDISGLIAMRAAAAETEQRFRSVFANAGDGMLLIDPGGIVTHANEAAQRIFGAAESALVGRPYAERFDEAAVWIARSSLSRVLMGQTAVESLQMRRRDGRAFPAVASAGPVRVGDSIVGIVATIRDMTAFAEATASLEASEERFRSLFDQSPEPIVALGLDGTLTRCNDAAARAFGRGGDPLRGARLSALVAPEDRARLEAAFSAAAAGRASTVEATAYGTGAPFPMLASLVPIVFRGAIAGVHVLMRDVGAIRRAERAVARHSERLRELYLAAASANEAGERQIAATIEAGCRLLGMSSGALYEAGAGRSVVEVGDPIPPQLLRAALGDGATALADPGGARILCTAIDVGSRPYGALCFASHTPRAEAFDESDRDLVQLMGALIASAIERGRARARLKQLAYSDQLTALPNRAWFAERLREELAAAAEGGTRVAVLFLDLDRFKDINDSLGHALGDRLLRTIGDRLGSVVDGEGLVARMGGDEFIVLAGGDPTHERLDALAQRIIEAIEQPLVIDGYEQYVTTSVGIALFPDDGEDADTLVKHADVAMYRAKERGRNTYQFFTPSLAVSVRTRISQEKSLRKALERGEFVVHYQPQFGLDDDRLVAVEALVRWNHPRLGLVGPTQFIASAEASGLIVPLGDFVLETASRDVRTWHAVFPDLRLAVNLSGRQLHHRAIAAKIASILQRTGLRPAALEIEITESVAMSDAPLTVQILDDLRDAGVRVALDDFGTGYSSLGYLRRFSLDSLKIDRSFVRDIVDEPDDATIVQTVIGMAHSLGLDVCAEGVETAEQLAFLRAQRCDRAQGFLWAPGMAAEELDRYLAQRRVAAAAG